MQIDNNASVNSFLSGGSNIPTPPRRGEVIICQMCGQPLLPHQFSKEIYKRKREFKWHIHPQCFEQMEAMADRGVPGLMAERKRAEEAARR